MCPSRTCREHASRAAPGFRIGFSTGQATPFGSERASGRGAGSGRQVEASSVEHAGLALVAAEDEAHLARDVLGHGVEGIGTWERLRFEPTNQLGAAARGLDHSSEYLGIFALSSSPRPA